MERTEYVKKLIDDNWSSRRKFAEHIGIPQTTLQSILERGIGKASVDNVIKICQGLGITADSLQHINIENEFDYGVDVFQYPYIPMPVSAGLPINIDSIEIAETISIPDELLGKYAGDDDIFFMRVNGDSMNKVMPHKSLIGIKPIKIKDLKNEDIVVYSDGYDYSVKRFYQDGDRILFRPESHDNFFIDYITTIDNEDIRIHGRVVTYLVNLD